MIEKTLLWASLGSHVPCDLSVTPHSFPRRRTASESGNQPALHHPDLQPACTLTCGPHGGLGHLEGAAPRAKAVSTVTAASLQTRAKVSIRCIPQPQAPADPSTHSCPPADPTQGTWNDCGTRKVPRRDRTPSRRLTLFFSTEKVAEQPVQLPDKERQQLRLDLAWASQLSPAPGSSKWGHSRAKSRSRDISR